MVNLNSFNPFASNNLPPPSKIISLQIYPIKSCRGFEVTRTTLRKRGLDLDRQWMFVDASTRKFLTIRDLSQMTLVRTSLSADGDQLQVRIEGTDKSIAIPAHPSQDWLQENTKLVPAKVWSADTDGYEYSNAVSGIFSDFFGRKVALLMKGPTPRILSGNGAPQFLGRTESTQFADGESSSPLTPIPSHQYRPESPPLQNPNTLKPSTPVLPVQIASQASIDELNARLGSRGHTPITIERFRPNIIIEGTTPWSEDSWKVVCINGPSPSFLPSLPFLSSSTALDLDVASRCARCQVPNVDPETAEKNKHEPWDTLMTYRRVDKGIKYKPCFGMLCVPRGEGELEVGMRFEVTGVTGEHFYQKGF